MIRSRAAAPAAAARLSLPAGVLAVAALFAGLWGGLVRLGWTLLPIPQGLAAGHGPLMVAGFTGTLIGLERAVALGSRWAFGAPLLLVAGSAILVAGVQGPTGPLAVTLGSAGVAAMAGVMVRRHPAPFTVTMGLGALVWMLGNLLWTSGTAVPVVAYWWAAFLVLTVAGERLELSRIARPSARSQAVFLAAAGLCVISAVVVLLVPGTGVRMFGIALIVLAGWLLRHDIARYTIRQAGVHRFVATCLMVGYGWLGVAGLLAVWLGAVPAGPRYDAMLHALFLGFVVGMIFGHAPIMLPALLGRPVPFRSAFYTHLVLLHVSLAARILGDLAAWPDLRQWSGLLNAVALLVFFGNTVSAVIGARPRPAAGGLIAGREGGFIQVRREGR